MATELQLLLINFTQLTHEVAFEMASTIGKSGSNQTEFIVLEAPVKVKNPKRVLAGQVSAVKRALRKAEEEEIEELARQAAEIMDSEDESESESDYESDDDSGLDELD
jgi:hypothetical protein